MGFDVRYPTRLRHRRRAPLGSWRRDVAMARLLGAAVATLISAVGNPAAAEIYSVTNLSVLPACMELTNRRVRAQTIPYDLNDSGQVVGAVWCPFAATGGFDKGR